jgi:diguanylate cyclase (GGDEF)-like protein/PAS domain S-box-containing protein
MSRGMTDELTPIGAAELERRFHNLVENIPGIVIYLDLVRPDDAGSSVPVYISPQIEDLLGYERAAWLGEDELWLDVLHPDDRERMVEADATARAELTTLFAEYRMVARDGRTVWVSEKAAVVRDEVTGNVYWQGVMVDITDRRNAEKALAASERQYRSVFDAATIGLMTLDLDGTVLEANDVVGHVLGYPAGALHGRSLPHDLTDDDDTRASFELLAGGHVERRELEHPLRSHFGSSIWCRTVMALVRDSSGAPDHVTAMIENIDQRKRAEADLLRRTTHDPLTTLPNREHFLDRLTEARKSSHPGVGVGVVFIDIDSFKHVNDTFGHDVGDELLVAVARRLRGALRPTDLVARFGGDEFLVLADGLTNAHDAAQLAWRLAGSLHTPFVISDREISVTASFGAAFSCDPDEPDEDLVRKADAAMYNAKGHGSNRVALFGERHAADAAA